MDSRIDKPKITSVSSGVTTRLFRVIVTGASGGVGGNLVQLAALGGARALALARDVERAEPLRALGAAQVGSYNMIPADFAADAVIENAGGAAFTAAMSRLAPGGIGVSIGNAAQTEFVLPAGFAQALVADLLDQRITGKAVLTLD